MYTEKVGFKSAYLKFKKVFAFRFYYLMKAHANFIINKMIKKMYDIEPACCTTNNVKSNKSS